MAVALIVAAGRGERLGTKVPKALVKVAGKPMVQWSMDTIRSLEAVDEVVVALPAESVKRATEELSGARYVAGGAVRSQSVRAALEATVMEGPVIVHDAARPLAPATVFRHALKEIELGGIDAVVVAAPLADTVKEVDDDGRTVRRTLERSRLWAAQTPQVFRRATLERVLEEASHAVLATATDDAWLVERAGGRVRVVPSEGFNLKVTTPTDLHLVELLLAERAAGSALP
ncbi:MAG: 2-C-methyl-D-erythritol 4-phosphate cytidylyltransferase [Solirubrobacteraceae bacterium]